MKFPILLISLCGSFFPTKTSPLLPETDLSKEKDVCLQELHLDATKFSKIPNIDTDEFNQDEKCLFRCLLLKLGVLGDDGKFDLKFLKKISAQSLNLERCYAKDDDDICETTYEMVKCSVDKFTLFEKSRK